MASNKDISSKLTALEGKLNTFGTLVNDNPTVSPAYKETLDAVYKELEELKSLVKGEEPTPAKAAS